MSTRLLRFAIYGLAGLLVFAFLNHKIVVMGYRSDLASVNAEILSNQKVIELGDGRFERQTQELDSERQLRRSLEEEVPELLARNDRLNRDNRSLTSLVAHFESFVDTSTTDVDVTPTPSGDPQVRVSSEGDWGTGLLEATYTDSTLHASSDLSFHQNGIKLRWRLSTDSDGQILELERDPETVHIVISQDSSGNWVTQVEGPKYWERVDFTSQIVPSVLHWYDRVYLDGGISTGPGLLIGAGIGNWSILKEFTNSEQGDRWILIRRFPLSSLWKR